MLHRVHRVVVVLNTNFHDVAQGKIPIVVLVNQSCTNTKRLSVGRFLVIRYKGKSQHSLDCWAKYIYATKEHIEVSKGVRHSSC